ITFDGSFGSGYQAGGRFANAQGIATDAAGRVYVADPSAGDVEIYDNAENGNRFLGLLGRGVLHNPEGVAIDNRCHVYVSDTGRETISMFDDLSAGLALIREWGGPGQALGQMEGLRQLVIDKGGLVYVAERDNQRVQWFKP